MSGYFIFNGIDSRDYGIAVTGVKVYGAPAKRYTTVNVPGRNGDIFIDNGNYNNFQIRYDCGLQAGAPFAFNSRFSEFRARLGSATGYCRLEDAYTPGVYRMGVRDAEVAAEADGALWASGKFSVTFSCKPQLFYNEGDFRLIWCLEKTTPPGLTQNLYYWRFAGLSGRKIQLKRDGTLQLDAVIAGRKPSTLHPSGYIYEVITTISLTTSVQEVTIPSTYDMVAIGSDFSTPGKKEYIYVAFKANALLPLREVCFRGGGDSGDQDEGEAWFYNPSLYESKPEIRMDYVNNEGSEGVSESLKNWEIILNGTKIKVNGSASISTSANNKKFLHFDSEEQTANGWGKSTLDQQVELKEDNVLAQRYPILKSGWNKMTIVAPVTAADYQFTVTPHFWTL